MDDGKRFTLNYLERSTPTRDSSRFRNRLSAYYWEYLHAMYDNQIIKIISQETGAEIPFVVSSFSIPEFFKIRETRDVLDSITLIYQVLEKNHNLSGSRKWIDFVTRVFKEENLGYRLDPKGGVHYFIDEEFERNRFSTLSILDDPKYLSVRAAYEDAYHYMDNDPPNTKAAVRSMFESVEILVKQMVKTDKLDKNVVEKALKEKCLRVYKDNETASRAASKLFDSFGEWVDGLHFYRHGQKSEEPVAPPDDITIYVLSSGSAFLRWLIEINNTLNS
jgi:hypothetical protein